MSIKKHPQTVLVLSDLHRGAAISAMPQYEKQLRAVMGEYDHVVLNGDIFELFYIDRNYYHEGAGADTKATRRILRHAIGSSIAFLDDSLDQYPNTTVHFVLGNHENIRKFRHQLDAVAKRHRNFEWSASAIRIGDGLFLHGDLPMANATNHERPRYGLKEATKEMSWAGWMAAVDKPGQAVVNYLRAPMRAVGIVHRWLTAHDGDEAVAVRHKGKKEPLSLAKVRHVFFGHTHVKFDNLAYGDVIFHNTGALTRTVMHRGGFGMLEATLDGGHIHDVRPVRLGQERTGGRSR